MYSNKITEQQNPNSMDIDQKSSLEILEVINAEDAKIHIAVKKALPEISKFINDDWMQKNNLAKDIENYIRNNMPTWKKQYQGVEEMTVAVMGCVVNGPGESKNADIGISLPGSGERPVAPVYENGQKTVTLKGSNISQQFIQILEAHVANQYAKKSY